MTPQLNDQVRRVGLASLYQPFAAIYVDLLAACNARGAVYYGISGSRSIDEQFALYSKGRIRRADGTWAIIDASQIVTKALPGSSAHNFGIAADSALDANAERTGLQPGWAIEDYRVLAEEARRLGLEAAYYWQSFREGPHVQLDLAARGLSLRHLASLYERGGMAQVHSALDEHDWRAPQ